MTEVDNDADLQREMNNTLAAFEVELSKRDLSNSENYDRAILASASGGLGLSIAFIKDVVHLPTAEHLVFLETSWLMFTFAILAVLASFQLSQLGLRREMKRSQRIREIIFTPTPRSEKALNIEREQRKNNPWKIATIWANIGAGVCFLLAVTMTAIFVWTNLSISPRMNTGSANARTQPYLTPHKHAQQKEDVMSKKDKAFDGAPVPNLQIPTTKPDQSKPNPAPPTPPPEKNKDS